MPLFIKSLYFNITVIFNFRNLHCSNRFHRLLENNQGLLILHWLVIQWRVCVCFEVYETYFQFKMAKSKLNSFKKITYMNVYNYFVNEREKGNLQLLIHHQLQRTLAALIISKATFLEGNPLLMLSSLRRRDKWNMMILIWVCVIRRKVMGFSPKENW